jgi:hypothetical protein
MYDRSETFQITELNLTIKWFFTINISVVVTQNILLFYIHRSKANILLHVVSC